MRHTRERDCAQHRSAAAPGQSMRSAAMHFSSIAIGVGSALIPSVFGVSGVTDCPLPYIGTSVTPVSSATIAIDDRSRATFDTARVVVQDV